MRFDPHVVGVMTVPAVLLSIVFAIIGFVNPAGFLLVVQFILSFLLLILVFAGFVMGVYAIGYNLAVRYNKRKEK